MEYIASRRQCVGGIVIYMPQEGRGIGLANKIKAYNMQELGLDTVDANRVLGFEDDYRQYGCVSAILEHLKVSTTALCSVFSTLCPLPPALCPLPSAFCPLSSSIALTGTRPSIATNTPNTTPAIGEVYPPHE
jgi:hypothetical protein